MSNIVKAETRQEALQQMSAVDRSLADTIMRRIEIEERRDEINAKWRASKEAQELKALGKEYRQLEIVLHEKNGARKMLYALLKKFGVKMPETKLTRLAEKNEGVRALVESN